MQHQAVVPDRPRRTACHLFADEPVLCHQAIVRERVVVKDVAELAVERAPLVVAHFEQTIFNSHGVVEILAEVVFGELGRPAIEVATVEQLNPFLFVGIVLRRGARQRRHDGSEKGCGNRPPDHVAAMAQGRHAAQYTDLQQVVGSLRFLRQLASASETSRSAR